MTKMTTHEELDEAEAFGAVAADFGAAATIDARASVKSRSIDCSTPVVSQQRCHVEVSVVEKKNKQKDVQGSPPAERACSSACIPARA